MGRSLTDMASGPILGRMEEPLGKACAMCGEAVPSEGGAVVLGKDVCASCHRKLLKPKIPAWVKAFGIAVLVATVAGWTVNARFFKAYADYKASFILYGKLELKAASERAERVRRAGVTIDADYATYADYLGAVANYDDANRAPAREAVGRYASRFPDDPFAKVMSLSIAIGDAFDAKDYALMHEKSVALLELFPGNPQFMLSRASGAAARYATGEGDVFREEAEEWLRKGLELRTPENATVLDEYTARIRYRIDKRVVIDTDEYEELKAKGALR